MQLNDLVLAMEATVAKNATVEKLGPTVDDVHIPTAMSDDEEAKLKESLMDLLITKSSAEQRIAYAIVYAPDTVDSQGDFASAVEIEKMAHDFMINSRAYDLQHMVDVPAGRASVVESYIAPVDITLDSGKLIKRGTWVVATYFDDQQLWNLVKSGQIRAYSIFGKGKRTPIV